MINIEKLNRRSEALENELQAKLGVRGRSLSKRLARAGRRLPRRIQKSGKVITDAQKIASNPKLARLQDPNAVNRAFNDVMAHLDTIDPADRRKGVVLGIAGGLVFNLLVLVGALVALLHWQNVI